MQALMISSLAIFVCIIVSQVESRKDPGRRLGADVYVLDQLPLSGIGGGGGRSALVAFANTTVTQRVANGFGNPLNKYAWSAVLTKAGDYCVGTLNVNMNVKRQTSYALQAMKSPSPKSAWKDIVLRLFSGSPPSYSNGGEIWCTSSSNSGVGGSSTSKVGKKYKNFVRVFKPSNEYVGFRKMIEYNGKIYAGGANGPNGPGLELNANLGGYQFDLGNLQDFNFSVDYSANNRKISINPYYTTSIQQDVYGPQQIANATQGVALFSGYPDGSGWAKLNTDVFTTWDRTIRAMCISTYSNRLFLGTESLEAANNGAGAKIIAHDGTNLNIISQLPNTFVIGTCIELEPGKMAFATWGEPAGKLAIVDEKNGDAVSVANNTQLAQYPGDGIMEMRLFKNSFYVGILGFTKGFTLLKTNYPVDLNTTTWTVITDDGFSTQQMAQVGRVVGLNAYPWSSAVVGDTFYLGTCSFEPSRPFKDTRGQLWASDDGANWTMIEGYGFDSTQTYGFRAMQTDGTKLYIATASNLFIPVFSEKPYRTSLLFRKKPVPLAKPFLLIRGEV